MGEMFRHAPPEALRLERDVAINGKKARTREERDETIRVADSKRRQAEAERESYESKRNYLVEGREAMVARREQSLAAEKTRKHGIWLQTVFAAKHAASTYACVSSGNEARCSEQRHQ